MHTITTDPFHPDVLGYVWPLYTKWCSLPASKNAGSLQCSLPDTSTNSSLSFSSPLLPLSPKNKSNTLQSFIHWEKKHEAEVMMHLYFITWHIYGD